MPQPAAAHTNDTKEELSPIGVVATRLALGLQRGNLVYIASDEQRAEAVAAALAAAAPSGHVVHLPSSDALPGDTSPASPANSGRRASALRQVRQNLGQDVAIALITTAEAAAQLIAEPEAYDAAPPLLRRGDTLALDHFAEALGELGYIADDRVDEPGEMAVRGQVADIFPADAGSPVRIEVAEGRIESIRAYDPATQLGLSELKQVEIGRASEPPVRKRGVTLFEHLPGAAIAMDPDAELRRARYLALAADAARGGKPDRLVDQKSWAAALKGRDRIELSEGVEPVPRFVEFRAPVRAFKRFATPAPDRLVVAGSERDIRFLAPRLAQTLGRGAEATASWSDVLAAKPPALMTMVMPIDRGWSEPGMVVVAAADLLGSRALLETTAAGGSNPLQEIAAEISIGDLVIHEDHGIASVAGLEPLPGEAPETDGGDAIVLEYRDGARRLVQAAAADRLWRYGAEPGAVPLDRLDGTSWLKRRAGIQAAIDENARELTALAAERAVRQTEPLHPDAAAYERFSAGFPFTETADQTRAIAAVRADMAAGKPMDRLVVGDVGYGKTEVAMRAAAHAALAGRQVAIAAPTTVLVRQHLESFTRRFEGTGIRVAGLSRLSSAAEKKAVKAGLADGSIHIVIGTAAIAGTGVLYDRLSLVVIDEEQRFGAADKTRLRTLSGDCHVLTLTATPIPRTLQTALVGLQQLSIIATPPARRQPIRTSIGVFDDTLVQTALHREAGRGGQSFVVVPRIEDMAAIADKLARLVPDLTVRQAHGKMPAGDIDEAMVRFAAGDGDVLLATNIIEAGLDVPRANTMIVWRADRFGLSQLHQLRGRVGRGSRRGQILLLTEAEAAIADATMKRLRTLQAFDRLGAGFAISARDMDLRGAGDLLGETQVGHVKLIGTDLYQHLLESALRAARGEAVEHWQPELRLGLAGRFPETWIPEVEIRVSLYVRLARLADAGSLDGFEAELEDRFGVLPDPARILLDLARARAAARLAGIARIDAGPGAIAFTPRPGFAGAPEALGLVAKNDRLLLMEEIADPLVRLDRVGSVLDTMTEEH